jgi:hypothetical protein
VARRPGRRLFYDIETSLGVFLAWRPGKKVSLSYENMVEAPKIICIAWKWENERRIHSLDWGEDANDKPMLEEFVPLICSADEAVAHNHEGFDCPWVRTRCIYHRIRFPPQIASIDTLRKSRRLCYFPSNRLDAQGDYLGEGRKDKPGWELWRRLTLTNTQADRNRIRRYCRGDVELLESVFLRLNPYFQPTSNRAHYIDECPECGSESTAIQKHRVTAAGYKFVQFQCKDCGKYHQVAQSRFDKSRKTREEARRFV